MSLCDVCLDPGHCCRRMYVHGGGRTDPTQEVGSPMSFEQAEHLAMKHRLPFRPLEQDSQGRWTYWCLNLMPNGRCGDYDNRPELCRLYVAGSDGLCVHHWKNEHEQKGGEPTSTENKESAA